MPWQCDLVPPIQAQMQMKTITQHIRDHLLAGVLQKEILYTEMRDSQWDTTFEKYMRNRMVCGGYRYGDIRDTCRPKYDNVGSLIHRAKLYLEDGNQEHLVDIANFALVEYVRGCCHPAPHWSPADGGHHAEKL